MKILPLIKGEKLFFIKKIKKTLEIVFKKCIYVSVEKNQQLF